MQGRAALCLERRAAEWKGTQRNRFLPNPSEYVRILFFAPRANLSADRRSLLRAAKRFYSLWGSLVVVAVLTLTAILWRLWDDSQNQRAERLMETVLLHPLKFLGTNLVELKPFQARITADLEGALNETNRTPQERLHATLALATFGDLRETLLLTNLTHASTITLPLIMRLLATNRTSVLTNMEGCLARGTPVPAPVQARFATVAITLGARTNDPTQVLRLTQRVLTLSNTEARAAFISDFPAWHYDLTNVAGLLEQAQTNSGQSDLLSGVCSALALIPWTNLSRADQTKLAATIGKMYTNSRHGGVHSAAFCALTKWGLRVPTNSPTLMPTNHPPADRDWFVNSNGMTMIRIPAGTFEMGDDGWLGERPRHLVRLTKPFYMSDREVTIAQFVKFVEKEQYRVGTKGLWRMQQPERSPTNTCPVHGVSWLDAVQFCNWLSKEEGRKCCYLNPVPRSENSWECNFEANGYRLPTEAEWEYACRSMSTNAYPFGNDESKLTEYGYYGANSESRTWPAGKKLPNGWGLFDMQGNVWEWCWDRYYSYKPERSDDPKGGHSTDIGRILRGGSWCNSELQAQCAFRGKARPDFLFFDIGFRVVVSP